MAQFYACAVVVSVMCLCICGICVPLHGFYPLFLLFVSSLVLSSSFDSMMGELTAVATVIVDTVRIVSCRRHCTLPHVPSVRWELY